MLKSFNVDRHNNNRTRKPIGPIRERKYVIRMIITKDHVIIEMIVDHNTIAGDETQTTVRRNYFRLTQLFQTRVRE
jgi:hypothetical protein